MNTLMARYILEILKDPTLFNKFAKGWYPDFSKYSLFIHKQNKNNENFSKTIKKYKLIKNNDKIYETVFSKDIDNISTFFDNDKEIFELSYGTIKTKNSLPEFEYPSVYVSNGVYVDTSDIIKNILIYGGSFVVGVCDNPNSIFYKENIIRLKEIETMLKHRKKNYKVFKNDNHRDKTLILSYRSDRVC